MLTIASSLGWLFLVYWTVFADSVHAQERLYRFHNPFGYNTALIDADYNLGTVGVSSVLECARQCGRESRCRSFNYKQQTQGGLCQLNSKSFRQLAYSTPPAEVEGFEYYQILPEGNHLYINTEFQNRVFH